MAKHFQWPHIGQVPVVMMQGRVHYYEGYPMDDVVLPIRLMRKMGAEVLFLTNLKMDPSESRNLLESYPQQAGELLELRLQYVASLSGPRK